MAVGLEDELDVICCHPRRVISVVMRHWRAKGIPGTPIDSVQRRERLFFRGAAFAPAAPTLGGAPFDER